MTSHAQTRTSRSPRRTWRLAWILSLCTVIIGGSGALSQGDERRPLPSFSAEVEANFKTWDLDGDGILSFDETTRLVPKDTFRDTAAAALAAVHLAQRKDPTRKASFSRDLLLAATPGAANARPPFEFYYLESLAHIRATKRALFAGGEPTLPAIHQGPLGDCYFVATLGALIHRSPKDVNRIVQLSPEGYFQVQFGDGTPIRIHHVTDAEIALGSFAEGQGLWLNVLEKAYGELIERTLVRRGIVENAIDALGDGGRPTAAMALLTGCNAGLLRFRPEDPTAAPTERRVEGFVPVARGLLLTNLDRRLLTCCSTPDTAVPPGMAKRHLYAVLDFDADRDLVHLWNPWGNSFEPNGPASLTSGYSVRQGRFSVPLVDFIRLFEAVIYETNQPAEGL